MRRLLGIDLAITAESRACVTDETGAVLHERSFRIRRNELEALYLKVGGCVVVAGGSAVHTDGLPQPCKFIGRADLSKVVPGLMEHPQGQIGICLREENRSSAAPFHPS
jgi:hypothetical protein